MVKRVEWSHTATAELGQILTYLRFEISHQTAFNFNELLQKRLDLLRTNKIEGRPVLNKKLFVLFFWANTIGYIIVGMDRLYSLLGFMTLVRILIACLIKNTKTCHLTPFSAPKP